MSKFIKNNMILYLQLCPTGAAAAAPDAPSDTPLAFSESIHLCVGPLHLFKTRLDTCLQKSHV